MPSTLYNVTPAVAGYLDILALKYPLCSIASFNGTYASLTVHPGSAPLPTQAVLDADIIADMMLQQDEIANYVVNNAVADAYQSLFDYGGTCVRNLDGTFSKQHLPVVGDIAPCLGTTRIIPPVAPSTTPPLVTDGTQVWTQVYVPSSVSAKIRIVCAMSLDASVESIVPVAIFRNSTCIAVVLHRTNDDGAPIPCIVLAADVPGTLTQVTYSCRVGLQIAGTWYVNTRVLGGYGSIMKSGYCIEEILS